MSLTWDEIQANALKFSKKWKDACNEEAQAQLFLSEFFKIFGVDASDVGAFEYRVPKEIEGKGYIDYLWEKKIAIEMKSKGKDLDKAYRQLKDYVIELSDDEIPALLMVCDFEKIVLHRRASGEKISFKTKDLHKKIRQFADIAGYGITREIEDSQIEVNVKAAEKMAVLHDALHDSGYSGHDLEVYLVRLLFCLFADDTGIFPQQSFLNYLENSKPDGSDLSDRIARLFEILNMSDEQRAKKTLLSSDLKQFRYINGSLFESRLPHADFDSKMRNVLIDCCHFSWEKISPAIFGAMFQGVMDKSKRRELGAHYTDEKNILKLIKPLFLDELWEELERVRYDIALLEQFHEKIARLKFLDPACGCGNFLIITYRELRELELAVLKQKAKNGQKVLDIALLLKVNVEQFYGIECEDFPCQIAQAGLWLVDHQMNLKVSEEFGNYFARLPLTQSATIVHGNALRIDWEDIVGKNELSYILGNPPFGGARIMTPAQKSDITATFGEVKGVGNLDHVTAWYKKATEYIQNTDIKCAFVSTNSITQGEQATILWRHLLSEREMTINFAYRTFKWSNEAKGKAAVFCVIIGFSKIPANSKKIFDENGKVFSAKNINQYLIDAPNVFITNRTKPLCDVPEIGIGNKPIDGGDYLFTEQEKAEFLKCEPQAEKWFRTWLGAEEFINGFQRYCLWLENCPPNELRSMPLSLKRVDAVKQSRSASKSPQTVKLAETPRSFHVKNMPDSDYLLIPSTSSEKRKYIPIGFIDKNVIASNAVHIIPNATLYHFGVLTSNVHNAWMRAVCGRLEMRYRYSKDIVYNNFPWAESTEGQKRAIEQAAQEVLDARAMFPDSSLADLYDPLTMPLELTRAHNKLDKLVMQTYGYSPKDFSESACVADLMQRYRKLTEFPREV